MGSHSRKSPTGLNLKEERIDNSETNAKVGLVIHIDIHSKVSS
jgi:hypothetical protein